jgi:hypothetical protein
MLEPHLACQSGFDRWGTARDRWDRGIDCTATERPGPNAGAFAIITTMSEPTTKSQVRAPYYGKRDPPLSPVHSTHDTVTEAVEHAEQELPEGTGYTITTDRSDEEGVGGLLPHEEHALNFAKGYIVPPQD